MLAILVAIILVTATIILILIVILILISTWGGRGGFFIYHLVLCSRCAAPKRSVAPQHSTIAKTA